MTTVGQDLQYAVRGLLKAPSFTVVALLSLALGIGATTALFSVIYGVLIAPYPYAKPDEIWAPSVRSLKSGQGGHGYTASEFFELQKAPMFSDVMATRYQQVLMTGDRSPESFNGVVVSANAFNFLGVPPILGRTIQPTDVRANGEPEPVVELTYGLWQRLFAGDRNALGKTLVLNGVPHAVIGVMPPRFGWYTNEAFWLPMGVNTQDQRGLNAIFRLKPGVTSDSAAQQLHAVNLQFVSQRPGTFPRDGFTTVLMNYLDVTVASGQMRSSLQLLFAAVGFLLLIACANVANLQLARNASRSREIVVRLAIGAGRRRVVRQLLTESFLLSLLGGALGVALAFATTNAIVALMPTFYVPNEARVTVNSYVLLFSLGVSVLTGVLSGITPALQCSRPDLVLALNEGARGGEGVSGRRTRNALVVAEIAMAAVLLASSSLAMRSFLKLYQLDPGFQPQRVLLLNLPLPPAKYSSLIQRNQFAQEIVERVRRLPGVESVAIGNGGLPFGGPASPYAIEGRQGTDPQQIVMQLISADYPQTMGIPLRRGRLLTESEVAQSAAVAVVNEAATRLWPSGEDPIGRTVRLDLLANPGAAALLAPGTSPDVTIVGIIGDTRNAGLRSLPAPAVYVPYTSLAPATRSLAIRASGEPMQLLNVVRQQVLAIDKEQPIGRPITIEEILGNQTIQPRFNMALFTALALLALLLATAGIYSVISYHVARRTREIGVRVSVGARSQDVLMLVLGTGTRLVFVGLVIGIALSAILVRIMKTQVFEIADLDISSMLIVGGVLAATALLASYIPARRASRIDPLAALRHD